MTNLLQSALVAATALAVTSGAAQADDRAEIEAVLSAYETALNASDTDRVLSLYAQEGVFMPQHSLPSVGEQAIAAAYNAVFSAITLDIDFAIDEIVALAPGWAFARTRSAGFVTINATGDRAPEANQELFILGKKGDVWKIARYIFSTTNPPRQ